MDETGCCKQRAKCGQLLWASKKIFSDNHSSKAARQDEDKHLYIGIVGKPSPVSSRRAHVSEKKPATRATAEPESRCFGTGPGEVCRRRRRRRRLIKSRPCSPPPPL